MTKYTLALVIAVLSVMTMSVWTMAQTVSEDDKSKALAVDAFDRGLNLYDSGDYLAASDAFRQAIRYKYNWKILYNIGQCEAAAKRYGLALEAFEEYLARSGDEISVTRRDEVMSEVSRLRQIVGILEVKAPDGAVISVDGNERGVAPLTGPVMLSAGVPHEVSITLDNEVLFDQVMKLTGGQQKNIRAEKMDSSSTADAEVSPDNAVDTAQAEKQSPGRPEAQNGLKMAGWITAGTGTAVVLGGLLIGSVGYSQAKALNDEHDGAIPSSEQGEVDHLKNMSLAADIMMGAGLAVAATGVVLIILHKRKYGKTEQVALIPSVAASMLGGTLTGRF